jgi:hypothetical protein
MGLPSIVDVNRKLNQPNCHGTWSVCLVVWERGSRNAPSYPDSL